MWDFGSNSFIFTLIIQFSFSLETCWCLSIILAPKWIMSKNSNWKIDVYGFNSRGSIAWELLWCYCYSKNVIFLVACVGLLKLQFISHIKVTAAVWSINCLTQFYIVLIKSCLIIWYEHLSLHLCWSDVTLYISSYLFIWVFPGEILKKIV